MAKYTIFNLPRGRLVQGGDKQHYDEHIMKQRGQDFEKVLSDIQKNHELTVHVPEEDESN